MIDDEEFPREALDEWTVPEMPSDMKERVMAQLHEQWNMGVPTHAYGAPPRRNVAAMAAIFAAGVAVAASGAAVFVAMRPQPEPPPTIAVTSPGSPAPAAVASTLRTLTVEVVPGDARVQVDGKAVPGASPFVVHGLEPGSHEVRVRREGRPDSTRVVELGSEDLRLVLETSEPGTPSAIDEEVPLEEAGPLEKVPSESHATTPVAVVRQAMSIVKGAMDKDVIRRIVRAHISEVRYCYDQGLAKNRKLAGRVVVQFTIGPEGTVTSATLEESTLSDDAVGECITKAVKRWTFPKPDGGGNVVVAYPFQLEPG